MFRFTSALSNFNQLEGILVHDELHRAGTRDLAKPYLLSLLLATAVKEPRWITDISILCDKIERLNEADYQSLLRNC